MPDDYITATTKRLAVIAASSTTINSLVRPGNSLTKLTGKLWPDKPNRAARDVPELTITCPAQRILNRNVNKTFSNTVGTGGDVLIWKECTFLIQICWQDVDRTNPNAVYAALEALLLADPRLGLSAPAIKESGALTVNVKEENSPRTGGTLGLVQEIRFPVTFVLRRADLVTPPAP
jgi:hypothetical protein